MAFTYQNNGNNTATVTATYTAPKAKVDAMLEAAAHSLWDEGYGDHGADGTRLWSAVSPQEKLALLDQMVKRDLVDHAKNYRIKELTQAAQAQANSELGNYDL